MLKHTLTVLLLLIPSFVFAITNPFAFQTPNPNTVPHKLYYIKLHYDSGKNILKSIHSLKSELLSTTGKVSFSAHNRTLIMSDEPGKIKHLIDFVKHLDSPTPEVLIRAKIINIDKDYLRRLGIDFSQKEKTATDSLSIPLFNFINDHTVNLNLNLLEHAGHAKVIASPQLFTLDNQSSSIESGSEIPYQQFTKSGGTSVAFKKAVLRLEITPTVLPQHRVLLKIKVNQDSISNLTVNGEPAIKTQNMSTEVITRNSHTVILGGILSTTDSVFVNGVPILQNIPLFGALFRNHRIIRHEKELLLMITPTIKYAT